ncbi:hypothetical protein, partial [Escherichia coli]|uniref:hypothetical protein n=1 Tax=Escherichia coli TaxID=562 RepID=UPI003C2AE1D7
MFVSVVSERVRCGSQVLLASALVVALAGCSADENPPDVSAVSPSAAASAPATPVSATSAPAATPAPRATPTPPANPLERFTGTYAFVETVTSSYYSTKDVGDRHKGTWTVTTDCAKKCVSEVRQKLK